MRKFTALLAAGLVLGASGMAMAADNATASATANIVTPITITKNTDMVIGNLVPGNGVVTLSTLAARTKDGSVALSTSGSTPVAAVFTVGGTGANTFSIDYTGSDSILTGGTNSDTMAVTWITEAQSGATVATGITSGQASTGTLAGGAAKIYGGAVVTVGAAQTSGSPYTGNLKLTVAYN